MKMKHLNLYVLLFGVVSLSVYLIGNLLSFFNREFLLISTWTDATAVLGCYVFEGLLVYLIFKKQIRYYHFIVLAFSIALQIFLTGDVLYYMFR